MWVKLRTTPEQRAAWYAKAEAKGVNFSELARQALDGITVRRRAQLRRIDPALLRQLARLGIRTLQRTWDEQRQLLQMAGEVWRYGRLNDV